MCALTLLFDISRKAVYLSGVLFYDYFLHCTVASVVGSYYHIDSGSCRASFHYFAVGLSNDTAAERVNVDVGCRQGIYVAACAVYLDA